MATILPRLKPDAQSPAYGMYMRPDVDHAAATVPCAGTGGGSIMQRSWDDDVLGLRITCKPAMPAHRGSQ